DVRQGRTRRSRLIRLFRGIWHDFPAHNPGLAHSLMEALAARESDCGKANARLHQIELELTRLLKHIIPDGDPAWWEDDALSRFLLMAGKGMIVARRWEDPREVERLSGIMAELLLHRAETPA